jgi:hypothetical protein
MGRSGLHWVWVLAMGVVALVGCQEVVQSTTYSFEISESLPDLSTAPSEGVEICQADTDKCDPTDANGLAELDVPSNQEVAFTLKKEGYGSYIIGDVTDGPVGGMTRRMYPHDQLEAIAEQLQTPYPREGGTVGLAVAGLPDFAGVTFIPVGSTSGAVGEPFYYDADSEPRQYSLDLEATTGVSGASLLPLAEGGFTEVAQGEQQFEFGGTVGDCSDVSLGWRGDTPNRIRVPVREGYITYGSMVCPGP